MFTFMTLVIMLIVLTVFMVVMVGLFGSAAIILFGDLIVCAAIIVFIIKWLFNRKKK